ncbi:MAG: tetratricopeptide repeat protein [Balneolaceae bacterium]
MKVLSKYIFGFLVLGLALGLNTATYAQDDARSQAIALYNNGQEHAGNGQFMDAISSYERALAIAQENGIDDIVELTRTQIPRVYLRRASQAYQQYQSTRSIADIQRTINYFRDAQGAAEEFGADDIVRQARGNIPQFYYLKSVTEFRAENFDDALESLNTAIELNANYATAYYQRAITLKRMFPADVDRWMAEYDRAIEVAQRVNDNRTLNNARQSAAEELIFRAVTLKDERQFNRAIQLLERVENYDSNNADAHFRLAEIHNERGNFQQARDHANRALQIETGSVVDRAKIYFELGMAQKGLGNITQACSAFENATYGEFAEPANHELQFELKCEGHAQGRR